MAVNPPDIVDDILIHYGKKGMRWGIRNEEQFASPKQPWSAKKKIAVGAGVVAVVAIGTYGAYKLHDARVQQLAQQGDRVIGVPFERKESLARKMTSGQIMREVVPQVNPNRGELGTSNNCLRCSFAYEMRRRGYNVVATRSVTGHGQTPSGMVKALSGAGLRDRLTINGLGEHNISLRERYSMSERASNIFKALAQNEEGARGELGMTWKGRLAGHSMSWEIIGGKPHIFDTQSGIHYASPEEFDGIARHIRNVAFTRLDDIDINENFLKGWVENANR